MKHLINRYATPFTTGLFLVSLVSGIALFFHWASSAFHSMHEWLSMVLILPFALHLWKNWGALLNYLRKGWLWIPLLLSLVAALPFAFSAAAGSGGGGNPAFRIVSLVVSAPLADLAPLLQQSPDQLLQQLNAQGYKVTSAQESLSDVAGRVGVQPFELLQKVMPVH
ncbi:hypothetical protein QCD60_29270 [Pokkaliibacter sp. MBI-7]|uniref:hypothetical protein n=1 Tax=Pokkaliibacter sp. MBI-7 TaxID=3040600 RepID=UPI00244D4892|nr:hypothetical protein [Pokkaliibacter sp. MBI-7]MDH2436608.1 hypothetical protein [Pokkaliibacter sp. MBI-7]